MKTSAQVHPGLSQGSLGVNPSLASQAAKQIGYYRPRLARCGPALQQNSIYDIWKQQVQFFPVQKLVLQKLVLQKGKKEKRELGFNIKLFSWKENIFY